MTRNADHFVFAGQDTTQNKMFYVISRLEGDAVGHVQPYVVEDLSRVNLEGWKKIIEVLKLAYADADPKGTARRAVIALYQTNKRFEHFWAEFHRLAQKAGMDAETTLEYLKDQLFNEIKDQLVNINDSSMDLATFVKVVQGISTKLDILGKTHRSNANPITNCANFANTKPTSQQTTRFVPQATRFAPAAPAAVTTTTFTLPSTATGTHAGPMDMSSVRRGPLTTEEKEQRNKLGLCRYCGQPGHIARDYNDSNTLLAKRRAAGIHEMTIALSNTAPSSNNTSENTPSPSIVALRDLLD